MLSDRVKLIKPSGIRKFFDLASQMEGVIFLELENQILQHLGQLEKQQYILLKKDVLFTLLIVVY